MIVRGDTMSASSPARRRGRPIAAGAEVDRPRCPSTRLAWSEELSGRFRRPSGKANDLCADADLELLHSLKTVRSVDVAYTSVSDACLEQIARLTELRVLSLGGTKITDVGLQTLQRLSNLQELYLAGTAIGDDGLKSSCSP